MLERAEYWQLYSGSVVHAVIKFSDRKFQIDAVQDNLIACLIDDRLPGGGRGAATAFDSLTFLGDQNIFFREGPFAEVVSIRVVSAARHSIGLAASIFLTDRA